MTAAGSLRISSPSETEIEFVRDFDAPRALVFACHTRPELVQRWLLGPSGWTMPVCEIDLCVGGRYRYVWHKAPNTDMGMGGVYVEIDAPGRLVATERFDESWYSGEALDTTVFTEVAGRTTLTLTVRYESRAARDMVLDSAASDGMASGYDRLAALLATLAAEVAE